MIWVWAAGAVMLVAAATIPLITVRYGARGRAFLRARDRARSLLSRLEQAIDAADPAAQWDVAAARRSLGLAEAALAGKDTLRGFRLAERWAREGLAALGQQDSGDG